MVYNSTLRKRAKMWRNIKRMATLLKIPYNDLIRKYTPNANKSGTQILIDAEYKLSLLLLKENAKKEAKSVKDIEKIIKRDIKKIKPLTKFKNKVVIRKENKQQIAWAEYKKITADNNLPRTIGYRNSADRINKEIEKINKNVLGFKFYEIKATVAYTSYSGDDDKDATKKFKKFMSDLKSAKNYAELKRIIDIQKTFDIKNKKKFLSKKKPSDIVAWVKIKFTIKSKKTTAQIKRMNKGNVQMPAFVGMNIQSDDYKEAVRKAKEVFNQQLRNKVVEKLPGHQVEILLLTVDDVDEIPFVNNLIDSPVFRSNWTYVELRLQGEEVETKTCGYDILMKNYPKKSKSVEELEKFFGKEKFMGLTPRDFEKFAKHHNISLYCADLCKESITNNIAKLANRHKERENQALVIQIANAHVYEVKDDTRRMEIINKAVSSIQKDIAGSVMVERDINEIVPLNKNKCMAIEKLDSLDDFEFEKDIDEYYVDIDDLRHIYVELLNSNKVYPRKFAGKKVLAIKFPANCTGFQKDKVIFACPQYEYLRSFCDELGLTWKGHNIPQMSRDAFLNYCKEDGNIWHSSVCNETVKGIMNSSFWHAGAYNNCLLEDGFNIAEQGKKWKLAGIDQIKQYSYLLEQGDYVYFDIDCTPQKYNGEEIQMYFYYVEFDDFDEMFIEHQILFHGNGYYDFKIIEFALKNKIISKSQIKYFINTHYSERMNETLANFVNETFELLGNKAKHVINPLNGSFNITNERNSLGSYMTDTYHEVCYYFHKYGTNASIETFNLENGNKIYCVQGYKQVEKITNDKTIYMSTVQRGNLETYKLLQTVKAHRAKKSGKKKRLKPVYIKTDCVFYAYNEGWSNAKFKPTGTDPVKHRGLYREEKNLPVEVMEQHSRFVNYAELDVDFNDWNENDEHIASEDNYYDWTNILTYLSVFIQGEAGTGKSWIIDRMTEYFTQKQIKFGVCAFTHTAANNVNGQTCHSFFGINPITEKFTDKVIRKISKEYEAVIIDECNQMPKAVYRALHAIKKVNPKFKLYMFGDIRQELPVKVDRTYLETDMFKSLCGYNLITLKKQCRADGVYAQTCSKYHDMYYPKYCRLEAERDEQLSKFNPEYDDEFFESNIWINFKKSKLETMYDCFEESGLNKFITRQSDDYDSVNIVKTNKKRCDVNEQLMEENKNDDSELFEPISEIANKKMNRALYIAKKHNYPIHKELIFELIKKFNPITQKIYDNEPVVGVNCGNCLVNSEETDDYETDERFMRQNMYLYSGLPIICNKTLYPKPLSKIKDAKTKKEADEIRKMLAERRLNKGKKTVRFHNNELLKVESFDGEYIYLSKYNFRDENTTIDNSDMFGVVFAHHDKKINYYEFQTYFNPGYALTTYKVEGHTIDFNHTIWEFEKMDPKKQYTALTRTSNCNLIDIQY